MNIKMVVFDMAGTTIDEDNVVYKTLHKAIILSGIDISYDIVLAEGAGKEKKQALKDILKHTDSKSYFLDAIFSLFLKLLEEAYTSLTFKPQRFAEDLFAYLKTKDIKVVLNTGYNQETAEKIIDKLGWKVGTQIDALITASMVKNARPAPDMINLANELFGIENSQIVKVGDSTVDIEEGKNAGCILSVAVLTGAHNKERLQTVKPDLIIDDLSELLEKF